MAMKKYIKQNICRGCLAGMLLAGAACLTGCQTADQADSGDMASVEISGHTEAENPAGDGQSFFIERLSADGQSDF